MTASPSAAGSGGLVPPGPGAIPPPCALPGDAQPTGANDNRPPLGPLAGLALAAERDSHGAAMLAIRPILGDGSLGAALMTTRSDTEIIALWRGLGRDFNLPLYLRDRAGAMTPVAPRIAEAGFPRSRGSALAGRRPRFLTRRKGPWLACADMVRRTRREG